ncbi:MAG: pyruvate dehydrogenase (acetyl-transferring) E1 component subunit alpha [Gammaproteobacteria bacterium]
MSRVASFEIHYTGYLDHHGELAGKGADIPRDPEALIAYYRIMVLTRTFDTKAIALQRTGKLGTYASSLGQEAIGAVVGTLMRPEDVLLTSYREYAAQFLRGVSMVEILRYWGGDERGMDFEVPRQDFPICVPVASHACHAVGVATAFKLRREPRVAVCIVGDGATSKGDFYEAINLAGVWDLPVVFVINNNQWAISVPRRAQSAAQTLAQKAIAAGMPGEQVDGNDVIALHEVISRAQDKARAASGPTLIEALTYRLCDHTTADDATRYRSKEEVREAEEKEPIGRLRRYLTRVGAWNTEQEAQLLAECTGEVEAAVKTYLAAPPQPLTAMFDYLYAKLPRALQEQRAELERAGGPND